MRNYLAIWLPHSNIRAPTENPAIAQVIGKNKEETQLGMFNVDELDVSNSFFPLHISSASGVAGIMAVIVVICCIFRICRKNLIVAFITQCCIWCRRTRGQGDDASMDRASEGCDLGALDRIQMEHTPEQAARDNVERPWKPGTSHGHGNAGRCRAVRGLHTQGRGRGTGIRNLERPVEQRQVDLEGLLDNNRRILEKMARQACHGEDSGASAPPPSPTGGRRSE